jgi:uncharacterized protein (DUF1697 family)
MAEDPGARRVALLRGINVGRAKRVAMADLRALVAELGGGEVRTLLNSGNVVFTAADAARPPADDARRIEAAIERRLGVRSRVTVLTAAELAAVVAEHPLRGVADHPSRLLVAVPADADALKQLAPLAARDWGPERLVAGRRAGWLWCPGGISAGRLAEAVDRALGDAVTMRNWNTITKLHALATPA